MFRDRTEAGQRLTEVLAAWDLRDPMVLGLPRGGVPVASEVALGLGAPLEAFVARKIGAPRQPEFGVGAVAEGGTVVVNRAAQRSLGLDESSFAALVETACAEVRRQVRRYRGERPLPPLRNRTVVLVDDGLATGVTAEAALRDLRRAGVGSLTLAVPVCAPETARRLAALADDVVCVQSPQHLGAVGQWYERFEATAEEEVLDLLAGSCEHRRPPG